MTLLEYAYYITIDFLCKACYYFESYLERLCRGMSQDETVLCSLPEGHSLMEKKMTKLPFWAIMRRYNLRKQAQFEAAVSDEVSRRVAMLIAEISEKAVEQIQDAIGSGVDALPTKFSEKVEALGNQICQLRKELATASDPDHWIFVAVILMGYKCNQEDTSLYCVILEVNPANGFLRAAQDPALRIIRRYDSASQYPQWKNSAGKNINAGSTILGAPRWNAVHEKPRQVSLLGEIYHLPR